MSADGGYLGWTSGPTNISLKKEFARTSSTKDHLKKVWSQLVNFWMFVMLQKWLQNALQKWLQKRLQTPLQKWLQTPLHVLQHAELIVYYSRVRGRIFIFCAVFMHLLFFKLFPNYYVQKSRVALSEQVANYGHEPGFPYNLSKPPFFHHLKISWESNIIFVHEWKWTNCC